MELTKKWVVLWVKGGRIGSRPLKDLPKIRAEFPHSHLIQRDDTGTEHWEILSPRVQMGLEDR